MNLDPDCLHRREFYGLTASAACGGTEPHIGRPQLLGLIPADARQLLAHRQQG